MLGALEGQYTDRLLRYNDSQPLELNSLADFKSMLFAWDSFKTAYDKTPTSSGRLSDVLAALNFPASFALTAVREIAANDATSFAQLIFGILVASQNSVAEKGLDTITKLGSNKFLDMLRGAAVGKSQIGTTTDANFATNAKTFFDAYGSTLQAIGAEFLPNNATDLASKAQTDVNARAALAALSVVSVQVSTTTAEQFSLYDPATGNGAITDAWIADRSKALVAYGLYWKSGRTDNVLGTTLPFGLSLPFPQLDDTVISDAGLGSSQTLTIDGVGNAVHYLRFGDGAADALVGGPQSDRLYGGEGTDVLSGLGRADYLEGNAGADSLDGGEGEDTLLGGAGQDTLDGGSGSDMLRGGGGSDQYSFSRASGQFGIDVVDDSGGDGTLTVDGKLLNGADTVKLGESVWESSDHRTRYTLVPGAGGTKDLIIAFAAESNRIVIRNWSESRSLGIALGSTGPQPSGNPYLGDFQKLIDPNDTTKYKRGSDGNYMSGGASPNEADLITASNGNDQVMGFGGDDALLGRDGDDWVDGGDGNDVLQGGLGADSIIGGEGNDLIFGSSTGSLAYPTAVNFTRPQPIDPYVLGQGFNWIHESAYLDSEGIYEGYLSNNVGRDRQLGDEGNFIDAGAGNDSVPAGTGDDIVLGGAGRDEIFGMGGSDVLYGGGDGDRIYGDGPVAGADQILAAGDTHGADVMDGGDGNDVLLGQGAGDVIYGGLGNDSIWGDDRDLAWTPAQFDGADYLDGGVGDDQLVGGGGDDTLIGGAGTDVFAGGAGNDRYVFKVGDSPLNGSGEAEGIYDNEGRNQVFIDGVSSLLTVYTAGSTMFIGYATGNTLAVVDGMNNGLFSFAINGGAPLSASQLISNYSATPVYGTDSTGTQFAYGGFGTDTLSANADGAVLSGGLGSDTLNLSANSVTVLYQQGDGADTIRATSSFATMSGLSAGATDSLLATSSFSLAGDGIQSAAAPESAAAAATAGPNRIVFGEGITADSIHLKLGTKVVLQIGDSPANSITLDGFDQTASLSAPIELFEFFDGTTLTYSQLLARGIDGSDQNDSMNGSVGNDALRGGAGDDTLLGNGGDDVLDAGAGRDTLRGGSGSDTYVFRKGDGRDNIDNAATDNASAIDTLLLTNGVDPAEVTLQRADDDLVVRLGEYDSVIVRGHFATGATGQIDEIRFDTGVVWTPADIQARLTPALPTYGDDIVVGTNGSDTVYGLGGNDDMRASGGNDYLVGGSGSDTYHLTLTSGSDVVVESAGDPASLDIVSVGPGVPDSALSFTAADYEDGDLVIGYNQTPGEPITTSIYVQGFFAVESLTDSIDEVHRSEGRIYNAQSIWDQVLPFYTQTSATGNVGAGRLGSDTITGYGGYDVLLGFAGDDLLLGGGAGDRLYGHKGNDTLVGGVGDDTLNGGEGNNVYQFYRGDGRDVIEARSAWTEGGVEIVRFGAGISAGEVTVRWDDSFATYWQTRGTNGKAGIGYRHIRLEVNNSGGAVLLSSQYLDPASLTTLRIEFADGTSWNASDVLARATQMTGTASPDTLAGSQYADHIAGLGGDDDLLGAGGDDTLIGGTGNDQLFGEEGNDQYRIDIGDGQDWIWDGEGVDAISFGPAITPGSVFIKATTDGGLKIYYSASQTDVVMIAAGTGGQRALEQIRFADGTVWSAADIDARITLATPFSDEITGTAASESLGGLAGDDAIIGNGGNDTLIGGLGNDYLEGGSGSDTYVFASGFGHDSVFDVREGATENNVLRLQGITPSQVVVSRDGWDNLYLVVAGSGDVLCLNGALSGPPVAGDPNDQAYTVVFDDGTTWNTAALLARLNTSTVTSTDDVWYGTNASDVIDALGGADILDGAAGNDVLHGGAGNDSLLGASGTDLLDGGEGSDLAYAQSSNVWVGGKGNDTGVLGAASANTLALFNAGDGVDTLELRGSNATTAVLSLGGISTADIVIMPSNNGDLRISFGSKGAIDMGPHQDSGALAILQVVSANSIQTYDLNAVLTDYRAAAGADPDLVAWSAATSLAAHQLSSSTNQVHGGDIAYRYAIGGSLSAMTDAAVTQLLGSAGFISTRQTLSVAAIMGTAGNDSLTGTAAADTLMALAGNDTLNGGAGADTMFGGTGNDTYIVDNTGDVVAENAGEGVDVVQSLVTYTLAAEVDNLTLTGTSAISGTGNGLDNLLTGNSANNTLTGGAGNDTLDGGTGNDTMVGGTGNDTFVVNVATDVVTELVGEGTDTVQSSATYKLASNVENLLLTGTSAINGTGNTLDNLLTGNSANNTLTGAAGNDTLDGGTGSDTLVGGTGNDTYVVNVSTDVVTENASEGTDTVQSSVTFTLGSNVENLTLTGSAAINGTGNTLANVLAGNSANNALDGGTGADTLVGGAGNDTYTVDNTGDVITELAGDGTDAMSSSVTYTLAANVENLTLTGTTAINGTGNALDNVLTGNSANNTLTGGAGNDTLNGGTGNDTMVGGAGNDVYYANVSTDVMTEIAAEGTDTVNAAVTLTLGSHLENLTLTGTSAINGTGNTLDNWLIGNTANNTLAGAAGNDTLDGGTGNDTMVGGTGNDNYFVNVSTDVVTENASEGTDTVNAAVTWTLGSNLENLTLTGTSAINGTGNTLDNSLTGNAAANALTGNAGADTLDGAAGNDSLVGGAGADSYIFGRGWGTDTVQENDATAGVKDLVLLQGTLTQNDLQFSRVGNNLEMAILGTSDKMVFQSWYLGNQYHAEEFRFSNGSALTDAQAQALVGAMAGFSAASATSTDAARPSMTILPVDMAANALA